MEVQEVSQEEKEKALENYATEFPDYDFTGTVDETVGDRHFEAEVAPENIVEDLVFHDYYYDIKGEYDKLSGIYGENDALKISAKNEEKRYHEGVYIKAYSIYSLSTWSIITSDILNYQFSFFQLFRRIFPWNGPKWP